MSHIDLVRLLIRIIEAFENVLVPQSMRFAGALYCGVRNLPEKFRFRPPAGQSLLANLCTLRLWCGPWLYRLIRRPAAWLLSGLRLMYRLRSRLPGWSVRFFRWLRGALIEGLVMFGGVALLVLLWLHLWT